MQRKTGVLHDIFQASQRVQGHECGGMRIRIESQYRHVGDDAMGASAAQVQFLPAAPAYKSRARQVGYCFGQLALLDA